MTIGKTVDKSAIGDQAAFLLRRRRLLFILLPVLLIVLFILDIFLGSVEIKPSDVFNALFNGQGDTATIILQFRIPKALTALFVGIALSLSGLQMQTVFRNPMAGPYVLGVLCHFYMFYLLLYEKAKSNRIANGNEI